jgi:selenide,water dikinase
MRGKAKGRWLDGAIATMVQSNRAAMEIFHGHGTTACTDITGFGLGGHLWETVRASQVHVRVQLAAIPWLEGVEEVFKQGIFSSLHWGNYQAYGSYFEQPVKTLPILFDPQTAGGLLASVPEDQAEPCLQALWEAGYGHSVAIGRVISPTDGAAIGYGYISLD